MALINSTPPSTISINGKVYNNKPFNGQTAKTLTKGFATIDTLDSNQYPSIEINLIKGVLVWAFASEVDRDANYLNLESLIGAGGGTTTKIQGFIDYNDTSSIGGISLPANVWVDIPNDGLGAYTNKNFLPEGVTDLIDTSTGYLDCSELTNGDDLIIRNDFIVTPNANRANLFFRYSLGGGIGLYTLEKRLDRLDSGAGVDYRFNLNTDYLYMGDDNTRLNPIKLQIKLSKNGTFINNGSAIKVGLR